MPVSFSSIDSTTVTACLRKAVWKTSAAEIIEREINDYSSRAQTEIVTCAFNDGTRARLFCKRMTDAGGYEAAVYQHVVQNCGMTVPKFYGSYFEPEHGGWLFLEFIDDASLLNEIWDPQALILGARWLGKFHANCDKQLPKNELKFLRIYDGDYYEGLAQKALASATDSLDEFPWLPIACERFAQVVFPLLSQRPTVAHGDYHPHNLLYRAGAVYPIDWEFAGIDLGEHDLATLTDGIPDDVVADCESEYQNARWPNGAPGDFELTLAASRVCLYFYNLASRPGWTTNSHGLWCSEQLLASAGRLRLVT